MRRQICGLYTIQEKGHYGQGVRVLVARKGEGTCGTASDDAIELAKGRKEKKHQEERAT